MSHGGDPGLSRVSRVDPSWSLLIVLPVLGALFLAAIYGAHWLLVYAIHLIGHFL